ncbi:MFS transporter [Halomonas sp. I5-271120]|uniref:MFS transporter n=1 Tax=Halomonas sp. I5-271120 TaxID=3061632 RepID=UPI0027152CA4|nr:MFS transporter [Halomonas sp. I5-271120]
MPTDSTRPTPNPRRAEKALALGGFAIGTTEFVIMGLMQRIATDYGIAVQDVGLAISAYALGVVVGAPLISAIGARIPRRRLLIGLMVLFAASNLLTLLAPSFYGFVALRFFAGLPHGVYLGVAALVAANVAEPHERGRAVGRVLMGLTLAILAGAPLATWVGGLLGWKAAFVMVGALGLCTALLVRLWVPVQPANEGASLRSELSAITKPRVLYTLAVACVGFAGMFSVFSYAMPTLTHQAGMSEALGPLVLAVFGVGAVIGNYAGGRLADANQSLAIGGALVWAALCQLGFFLAADQIWSGMLFVGLVGTCGALVPPLQTRLMDVAGEAQTMAATLNHAAFNIANGLGAWLGGMAVTVGLGWSATGLVGMAMALAGLVIFLFALARERATQVPA